MFRTLFRSRRKQTVVRRNLVRKPFRPTFETLEDRCVPAVIDWTAGIGDNFNVAADWTVRGSNPAVHRVPGPGDDVVINLPNDVIVFTESHEFNSLTATVARFQTSGNGTTLTLDGLLHASSINHLVLGANTVLHVAGDTTSLTSDSLIAGTVSVSPGATVAFTGGSSLITVNSPLTGTGNFRVAGGTVSISSGVTVDAPVNFVLASGGTVGGEGTFNVPNTVTVSWTGGTFGTHETFAGTTTIAIGGKLSLTGANQKILDGGSLTNNGTVTWAGDGLINAGDEAVVNNNGTWDIQSNQSIIHSRGNQATFNNAGTLRKSTSSVNSSINITFNNSGAIDVQTGNLFLFAGTSTGGTFTVAGGSLLDLTNGQTQNISGTFTGSGAGTVRFSSGTLNVLAAGATFNFPGNLFQWTGGTIAGGGPGAALTNNGTLNLASSSDKVFDGLVFNNPGTLSWSGGRINAGDAAALNNSGMWAIQGDLFLIHSFGGTPSFNNAATAMVSKTRGSLSADINIPFNNSGGTVEVQSGNLFLFGGTSTGGTYNAVNAGTLLDLTNGQTQIITGTYAGSGAGTVRFSGGTLVVAAAGATLNFPGSLFQWTGGTIAGGAEGAALTNSGTLNLASSSDKVFDGLAFDNPGTLSWSGGRINAGDAAALNNSGMWAIQGDLFLIHSFGATPSFNNAGTGMVSKTSGSLSAEINIPFNNSGGTVEVRSGNLFLFGGTSTGGIYNAVNAGTLLDLTNGQTQIISGTYTGSGAGTVRFSGGSLVVPAAGATLNFPAGLFQWTGGTLVAGEPAATLTNSGDLTLTGENDKVISALVLANNGTVTWAGKGRINAGDAAVVNNSGTWTIQNDVPLIHSFGLTPTFNNIGALTKAVGASTSATAINIPFNNISPGTVNVNSGVLQLGNGGTHSGTFNAAAGTILQFSGGTHTLNTGTVLPSDGLTQVTGGATVIVTDVIAVQNLGLLSGTLRITSTGILNVGGNYDQTTGGSLVIEIGGTTAGAGFGQLNVAGTASLAGAFTAVLVNDFAPDIGQSFPVLTCGSRNGTFNGVYLPGLPPGRRWDMVGLYGETGFTLTVIPS